MKVTVELPEDELREICSLTGIAKKGPAIRKLLHSALLAERRARIAGKFLSGEWSAELDDFEAARDGDRRRTTTLAKQWRD